MPDARLSLLDGLRTVSCAISISELDTVCTHLVRRLDFAFFAVFVMSAERRTPAQFIMGNTPPEWHSDLTDLHHGWLQRCPPQPCGPTLPFCWDERLCAAKPSWSSALQEVQRLPVYGSSALVVRSGQPPAFMSLMRPEELPACDQAQYQVLAQTYLLANIAIDAWQRVEKPRPMATQARVSHVLTRRERQCLTLAAEGDTSMQIGARLGISKRTAAFHIDRAIRKLQVHSRAAAVKKAILTGQITPVFTDGDVYMAGEICPRIS